MPKPTFIWTTWITAVLCGGAYLGWCLNGVKEEIVLPGRTTHGHYQIELDCRICHAKGEGGIQDSCLKCHEEELKRVEDSHPGIKFKDPRNADRLKEIDARLCVTCHREHQPELTGSMGLSIPSDYCYYCHQSIAEERPTHKGLGFETCATAGCHNFHDNSALYEKFLTDHLDEPELRDLPRIPGLDAQSHSAESRHAGLGIEDADVPEDSKVSREILRDWNATAHAKASVNCSACHSVEDDSGQSTKWTDHPGTENCLECHPSQSKDFQESRHGMRIAQGMDPMQPGMARLPMRPEASHRELTCISCHQDHRFDTRHAAVEACLQCHNDNHTLAYLDSPHYTTWLNESRGVNPPESGVGCATCHLPRVKRTEYGETTIVSDHNPNNTLRPNEKMIRSSCLHCHGLQFTLNSLADPDLIQNNFNGKPAVFIRSLEMAREEMPEH